MRRTRCGDTRLDETWLEDPEGSHLLDSTKDPASLRPEFQCGSRLTLSSIIYCGLSSKKQKMSQSFSNNINSFHTVNNFTVADDRSNILAWLSPLEPGLRHQDIQDLRVEKIGEWLLQTEEFKSWCASSEGGESDNGVLFVMETRELARLILGNKRHR